MNRRALVIGSLLVALALGLASLSVSSSKAQSARPEWSWPDSSKNLKVLPSNSDKQKLRAVMTGFTRALGVRCSHCHVGTEGQPLSTYDFASDKNPKKDVARGMLRMLGSINDQLKQIQPNVPDRVNMWCNTCHHGVARPRTLVEELTLVYDKAGADSTLTHYRRLRETYESAGAYDFREPTLNTVGYYALGKKDARGGVAVLKLNAELFPISANVHDSLGEAYLAAGDTARAIAEYERSKQIDPKSANATKMLETLRKR